MSDPTNRSLSDLLADLDASEAEIEAGEVVPAEQVFADLDASLARLEAKRHVVGSPRTATRR